MTLQMALKQLRAEMNINQKTLAQLIGIDATTLNRWEKGKIKPQRVSALLLLNFAKDNGLSEGCQNALRDALFPNYKIETEVNDLRTAEISKINGVVNDSSNGVIVIDMDTFEILYINNRMLELENHLLEEVKCSKCYQLLLKSEERCADCGQHCGGRDDYKEIKFSSPRTGKHYLIRSREILWSGKTAQIKYITDITEMQKMKEEADYLRESLHIASSQAKMAVFLYDISNHRARLISRDVNHQEIPEVIDDFPQVIYDGDQIDPECMDDYRTMVACIETGQDHAEAVVRVRLDGGLFHWTRFQMHLMKSDENGKPEMAVCSVTEIDKEKSMERRVQFEHQKILEEGKGLLTYVVSNLTRNRTLEAKRIGEAILPSVEASYSKAIENACACFIQEKDAAEFRRIHDRQRLLDNFEKGIQTCTQQYQLKTAQGHIIWASNTLNLYQDTLTDEIYLYEYCYDIFEQKLLDGMISACSLYHYDAFGMIFLNNGQLTKVHYLQKEKGHTTEIVSYEEEAELLIRRYICEEDRHIREPYQKLEYIKEKLEDKELISLMYRIKMQDGTTHRMLERISWYDRENHVCFISVLDVDKTEADISGELCH